MSLATTMATQATVLRIPLVALATLVLGLSLAMPTVMVIPPMIPSATLTKLT